MKINVCQLNWAANLLIFYDILPTFVKNAVMVKNENEILEQLDATQREAVMKVLKLLHLNYLKDK